MSNSASKIFLRIAPFITIILLEVVSVSFRDEISDQFENAFQKYSEDGSYNPKLLHTAEEIGFKQHHLSKIRTHFDFSIIATVIIFVSSSVQSENLIWVMSAIILILAVVLLRRTFVHYLDRRAPNRYLLSDLIKLNLHGRTIIIYYGEIGIIFANLLPILAILLIQRLIPYF